MDAIAKRTFLAGGGEMGERTRSYNWSASELGPPEGWQQSLKTAVSICLGSRHPIVVWWGRSSYIQFYNDAYISFLGQGKHPACLGRSGRECWAEIWPTIGPMLESVFETGIATWSEDLLLVLDRNLPREEGYFTFSYSPIRDDNGGIGGIFCACSETTSRVIGQRRLQTLRDLGQIAAEVRSSESAYQIACRTLAENAADIPFVLTYALRDDVASLAAMAGLEPGASAAIEEIDVGSTSRPSIWPLRDALISGKPQLVTALSEKFGPLPGGLWPEPSHSALIVPIAAPGQSRPTGFIVAGLSPRLIVDADYRSFLDFVAGHVGTAIANARAYEEERERAEALAELDRAKTRFFSNVSHEFRTPLTLMLGPIEDALQQSTQLSALDRERLQLAHRNSQRLLKLVNTLLDFSRIEAGRIEASYEETDLATFTAELASLFRSAIERAGIKLEINCPSLPQSTYVDREMWEKIVLNLVSNAFKFTFDGEIVVTTEVIGNQFRLTVEDTGTGIPSHEMPRLFERFHRVKGARGRSYEGSGIGLALVQELVKLHGGDVRVESELDCGSRFVVCIPTGKDHLPSNRIGAPRSLESTGAEALSYVSEAVRWLGNDAVAEEVVPSMMGAAKPCASHLAASAGGRIIVADDNADMSAYVCRLLAEAGYSVEAASDGADALSAAQRKKPDLILSDIMMPRMDGIALLKELRARQDLHDIPVILLSAKAGEEAQIDMLRAGADDYLVKPFSAREMLARIDAHIHIARLRKEATNSLRRRADQVETLINQAPLGVYLVDADFRLIQANPVALTTFGDTADAVIGRDFGEIIHRIWDQSFADDVVKIFRRTLETGEPYYGPVAEEYRIDRKTREYYEWRTDRIPLPDGRFGVVCYFRDIGDRIQSENTQRLLLNELNHRIKNTLASVQAVMQQTLRHTKDPEQFAIRFSGRVRSLARAHSLLTDLTWHDADLRDVVRDQIIQGPGDEARVTISGPSVKIAPQIVLHLALMLHELGTNSAKYGALSASTGHVSITWTASNRLLELTWKERGGPLVREPSSRGFGTSLIERSTKGSGGHARSIFAPEGVTWEIVLPLPEKTEDIERTAAVSETDSRDRRASTALDDLSGWRFLIIEDEPVLAMQIADLLRSSNANVVGTASTASEALAAIQELGCDFALLDANLHGQPVDAIAEALSARSLPFVFVTGYGNNHLPAAFQNMPVVGKPFSDKQLLEAVGRLVQVSSRDSRQSGRPASAASSP